MALAGRVARRDAETRYPHLHQHEDPVERFDKEMVLVVAKCYGKKTVWRDESLVRLRNLEPEIRAWKKSQWKVEGTSEEEKKGVNCEYENPFQ